MSANDAPPPPPKRRPRPGPWPPAPDQASAQLSWAKRTGFKGRMSGESNASLNSGQIALPKPQEPPMPDLEAGRPQALPAPPVPTNPPPPAANGEPENIPVAVDPAVKKRREPDGGGVGPAKNGANGTPAAAAPAQVREEEEGFGGGARQGHINYQLRDTPGLVPFVFYGIQHYLSILGSLILIPLVIVPAMGGTSEDTSMVVSTVFFISGVTTLLHTFFGTRLPLIQGPSFVYLAPALAIINSREFQGLNVGLFVCSPCLILLI